MDPIQDEDSTSEIRHEEARHSGSDVTRQRQACLAKIGPSQRDQMVALHVQLPTENVKAFEILSTEFTK
jgi:hypothetical protein